METTPLIGPRIELRPMRLQDADDLVRAASDGQLWNLPFTIVPNAETVADWIGFALKGEAEGHVVPYVTCLRMTGQVIGSTRFWQIDRRYRTLEIGSTWIAASWQRSFVNTEAKYLMLRHAFEQMDCIRVQLRTDEVNSKSRAAILRLGAKEEGLMRHERIMPDGRKRNSVLFSVIDDEWPAVKAGLEQRMLKARESS
jgi:RimJ/RimL family protein N-acetyltransferase